MIDFCNHVSSLFARRAKDSGYFMLFSMRLDETGTDGLSDATVVGGAVATTDQWNNLERKWAKLISQYDLEDFQWKDWIGNRKPFSRWSPGKKRRFSKQQDEIIKKNILFRCAVSVDRKAHAEIKGKMRGVKGLSPDSDYSLGIRALMFRACEDISQNLDPNCRLSVMVEDGPWSSGAFKVYQSVSKMTGKWKPAKHAHRLAGFDAVPKGELPSMSVADYICGKYLRLLETEQRLLPSKSGLLIRMDADRLYDWYEGMIEEKESRRRFANLREQRDREQ